MEQKVGCAPLNGFKRLRVPSMPRNNLPNISKSRFCTFKFFLEMQVLKNAKQLSLVLHPQASTLVLNKEDNFVVVLNSADGKVWLSPTSTSLETVIVFTSGGTSSNPL